MNDLERRFDREEKERVECMEWRKWGEVSIDFLIGVGTRWRGFRRHGMNGEGEGECFSALIVTSNAIHESISIFVSF